MWADAAYRSAANERLPQRVVRLTQNGKDLIDQAMAAGKVEHQLIGSLS